MLNDHPTVGPVIDIFLPPLPEVTKEEMVALDSSVTPCSKSECRGQIAAALVIARASTQTPVVLNDWGSMDNSVLWKVVRQSDKTSHSNTRLGWVNKDEEPYNEAGNYHTVDFHVVVVAH